MMAHDHVRAVSLRQGGRTAITNLVDNSTRCFAADDPAEQKPLSECPADLTTLLAPHAAEKMRALGYVQ